MIPLKLWWLPQKQYYPNFFKNNYILIHIHYNFIIDFDSSYHHLKHIIYCQKPMQVDSEWVKTMFFHCIQFLNCICNTVRVAYILMLLNEFDNSHTKNEFNYSYMLF